MRHDNLNSDNISKNILLGNRQNYIYQLFLIYLIQLTNYSFLMYLNNNFTNKEFLIKISKNINS